MRIPRFSALTLLFTVAATWASAAPQDPPAKKPDLPKAGYPPVKEPATGGPVTYQDVLRALESRIGIAVILDCSASMIDKTPEGPTRMEAAKKSVADLIKSMPEGVQLSFIIYGHDRELRCDAVKILRPLGPLTPAGKNELQSQIAELRPVGSTPIALALRKAGEELARHSGVSAIVLVTDGVETCKGDPAAEAAKLAGDPNRTLGVHVVGFGLNSKEREAVETIAVKGKGKYYNAASAKELAKVLQPEVLIHAAAGKEPKAVTPSGSAPAFAALIGTWQGKIVDIQAPHGKEQVSVDVSTAPPLVFEIKQVDTSLVMEPADKKLTRRVLKAQGDVITGADGPPLELKLRDSILMGSVNHNGWRLEFHATRKP